MRTVSGTVAAAMSAVALIAGLSLSGAQPAEVFDPHGDANTGVLRVLTDPPSRGECQQCHPTHGDAAEISPSEPVLFTTDDNRLAYFDQGIEPCHGSRPTNYPLGESDRLPETAADPGYFEANNAGERRVGVQLRGRWPGPAVFENPGQTPSGSYYSPHAFDPQMPRRDAGGEGLCLNCHDPHGKTSQRDLLVARYGAIDGHASAGPPQGYALCFSCHGREGTAGMGLGSRAIEDYYDAGLNGVSAGHQIRKDPRVALSWPSYMQVGDMLPCYDCHNPHGSEGYNRVQPNGALIDDHIAGWSGLTDIKNDRAQSRVFCLGCHIVADGIAGSQVVHGIVMNTLSDATGHHSTDATACHDCHGRDYDSPTGFNVHHPATGSDAANPLPSAEDPWGP